MLRGEQCAPLLLPSHPAQAAAVKHRNVDGRRTKHSNSWAAGRGTQDTWQHACRTGQVLRVNSNANCTDQQHQGGRTRLRHQQRDTVAYEKPGRTAEWKGSTALPAV